MRQWLIGDFDGPDGVFRSNFVHRGDTNDFIACPLNGAADFLGDLNRLHSRHFFRGAGINADDFCFGMRRAQNLPIEHAIRVVIVGVLGAAGDFYRRIYPRDALADQVTIFRRRPTVIGHDSGSFLGKLRDDFLNAVVSAAAAEVATHAPANVFRGGFGVLVQKRFSSDDEPGSAEAALRSVLIHECLLHGMELATLHQSFNRGDLFALRLDSQNGAAIHNLVVHHYGAGTAFGAITDPLAAGKVEIVA